MYGGGGGGNFLTGMLIGNLLGGGRRSGGGSDWGRGGGFGGDSGGGGGFGGPIPRSAWIGVTGGESGWATPDPVDFYLLGVANQLTSHFSDAISAFTKCSTAGPLQPQCKAGLDDAKKKSQNSLEAPK